MTPDYRKHSVTLGRPYMSYRLDSARRVVLEING